MPTKPATICNGCNEPVRGSCPACSRARERARGSAHQRGYGRRWRLQRAYVLAIEPICRTCKRVAANEVDHIKRKADGGTDDISNLQPLCKECHAIKTALENGKGGGI